MFSNPFLLSVLVILIFMTAMFLIGTTLKNNGIVDVGWGLGFCAVSLTQLLIDQDRQWQEWLITGAILLWGLRLAVFLGQRNIGKSEDYRYANWRKQWGRWVILRSFFQIYMLQGFFMFLISLPVIIVFRNAAMELSWIHVVGVLLFLIGFLFEAIGDAQKSIFRKKRESKDAFIQTGLWRYTRHPNYFGEATLWWGIFLIALPSGDWFLSIISPIVISWLLLKVSGIPMLEEKYNDNPAYQAYKERTSPFLPFAA